MNTEQYVHMMAWLQALTGLIEQMQVRPVDPLRVTSALSAPVTSLQEEFVSDVALFDSSVGPGRDRHQRPAVRDCSFPTLKSKFCRFLFLPLVYHYYDLLACNKKGH